MRSPGALTRTVAARIRESAAPSRRPPLLRELLLLTVLYLAYKFGRRAANGQFADAYANADRIWDLERAMRLPNEAAVQDLLLHSESLVRAINIYYATVHFPAILLFLGWMFWRHPGHYTWIRWVLVWLTGAGLVLHLLFPLAPPRLFGRTEMMDTSAVFGPAVYGKPEANSMANQFAAMPSLHVGWAVVIAVGLIVAGRGRLRWLWVLHPLVTVVAVVATGHHYWMDGLVACALLAVILLLLRPPRALPHTREGTRRTAGARPSAVPVPVPEGAGGEADAPPARATASRTTER
ncbi:phosphatase PAP2 family protein [Streptomyces sp. B6B3]|uniref:phosphatase PAP2 family protein n=1 Tax=Streptomyces sp. B6B3 TaxID=3153570 RepID=UPI00325DD988